MKWLIAALSLIFATPSFAQTVSDCEWESDLRLIAEPWEEHTRAFSNAAVRVVMLDTGSPAMIPFQLLVISPAIGEDNVRLCRVITGNDHQGFAAMDFAAHSAVYEEGVGLIFSLPVTIWTEATDSMTPATLSFSLNDTTGNIETQLDIAGE